MEKKRLQLDGPGYEYRRDVEQRALDTMRGALLFRALLRAKERRALLALGDAAPALEHAHLARVLETGVLDGTSFALIEDTRDARTVAELIATHGAAHWQEAALLGRGLARALAAIHGAGLVHGDLGLSSVHVTARWQPLLTRRLEPGDPARNLRELGAVIYAVATGTRPALGGAPYPRALNGEIPIKFADLIVDLLDGDMDTASRAAVLLDSLVV